MKPRDYQDAASEAVFDYFARGGDGNPLIALPTGTGKSIVLSLFIKRVYERFPNQKILKLTHRKELIDQNFKTLLKVWPTAPAGIYSAGLGRKDTGLPIIFAGIASVVQATSSFGWIDLVLIDEAHLVSPKDDTMYQTFLKHLKSINPDIKIIGLTATKYRMGQGLLTDEEGLFTDICFDMTELESFNWFIEEGYLVPLVPKQTATELDVDNVKIHGGEYVLKDLQAAVDRDIITKTTLEETLQLAKDRQHWLVFASGIDHAVHVSDMLTDMGISSKVVHSKMPDYERDQNILDFKAGKFTAMVNNGILTTGFDYPAIDLIVMLRPTRSPVLWVQMLGRGTRPVYPAWTNVETKEGRLIGIQYSTKKNCLVLDFAGNTRRLGPINDPVLPRRKGAGNGSGEAPIKVCPICGVYNHASVRICASCGGEFPREVKIARGASTDVLIATSTQVEEKQIETFYVDRVIYEKHSKEGRPDSMKVTYYSGLNRFREFVCFDHIGYGERRARWWWNKRRQSLSNEAGQPPVPPFPDTTEEALNRAAIEIRKPKLIRVHINKEYPEVVSYED